MGRIYLVDRPDAAQTVVAQYLPAPMRTTPDYDVLTLVDAVWGGGGFGTRLNLNLREDKGYSYGVFSNFNPMRTNGNWSAGGGVQTDKTAESMVEFDKELKDLAGVKPITADELAVAKARRVRGYAQQFESLGRITGQIANLWVLGLPLTELQREYDATEKLTLDQVLAAAKKYVQPAKASLLLVGDRSKIEARSEGAEPRRDRRARHRGQGGSGGHEELKTGAARCGRCEGAQVRQVRRVRRCAGAAGAQVRADAAGQEPRSPASLEVDFVHRGSQ